MKLELKHLAPYLPYGLQITVVNRKLELGTHHSDKTIHIDMVVRKESLYKPILRPLSDLTKEIVHNGEKFVPNKRLDWALAIVENMVEQGNITGYGLSWDLWQLLFEWHFDVFGLIDKGLAIEKP